MKDLLFKNPVFHSGLNITVRDGVKWGRLDDTRGLVEEVSLRDTDSGRLVANGAIFGRLVLRQDQIPQQVMALNHDPACRTPKGLEAAMQAAYGDDRHEMGFVTVLFFMLDNRDLKVT